MAYDYAAQEAHARILFRDQDTLNPAFSAADFLSLYQETWFDYFQRFGIFVQVTSPDVTLAASDLGVDDFSGAVSNTQGLDIQAINVKFSGDTFYTPMGLSSWQRVLYLQTTEGQAGRARIAGVRFENPRDPSLDRWPMRIYFYPIPGGGTGAPAPWHLVARRHPALPGDAGTDQLQIDPVHARYLVRIVAARAAVKLGHPSEYVRWIVGPVEQWFAEALQMNQYLVPTPQKRRQVEEAHAA